MMRGMAWFCALMLAAVAQGVVGFHVTPGVQLSWKSTLVRASRAHPSVRIARPLHALRAQIHTRDGRGYGVGNMGAAGIRQFRASHRCNAVCRALGLKHM